MIKLKILFYRLVGNYLNIKGIHVKQQYGGRCCNCVCHKVAKIHKVELDTICRYANTSFDPCWNEPMSNFIEIL